MLVEVGDPRRTTAVGLAPSSGYASVVGIPVALLGLISYMLILITLTMRDARALLTGSANAHRVRLQRVPGRPQRLRARRCSARLRAGSRLAICCAKWLSATSPYCSTSPSTSDCALKAMYCSRS